MKKESKIKIASIYAQALYDAAEEKKCLDAVLRNVDELLKAYPDYQDSVAFLANPLWEIDDKIAALKAVAQKLKLHDEVLNCLEIVAQNNRFAEYRLILQAFRQIYFEKHNIAEVDVESVLPLSSAQDAALKTNLKSFLKKDILINYHINPDIMGGLVVSYNSEMIDDSLKGKLNRLETIMKGGQ